MAVQNVQKNDHAGPHVSLEQSVNKHNSNKKKFPTYGRVKNQIMVVKRVYIHTLCVWRWFLFVAFLNLEPNVDGFFFNQHFYFVITSALCFTDNVFVGQIT